MNATAIKWKFRRGKGWKKWVSDDGRSWVTQWLVTPGIVYIGINRVFTGARNATPQEAMELIERQGS